MPDHPEIDSDFPIVNIDQLSRPTRHHDPAKPLRRSKIEKFTLWFFEVLILVGFYYMFAEEAGGGLIDLYFLSNEPAQLLNFNTSLWISVWFIFVLAKIFKRSAVISGAIIAEILVELYHFQTLAKVQWVLVGFIGFSYRNSCGVCTPFHF